MASRYKIFKEVNFTEAMLYKIMNGEIRDPSIRKCFEIVNAIKKLDGIILVAPQIEAMFCSEEKPMDVYEKILSNPELYKDYKTSENSSLSAKLLAENDKLRIEVQSLKKTIQTMMDIKSSK